jgi:hypothetical protein
VAEKLVTTQDSIIKIIFAVLHWKLDGEIHSLVAFVMEH